MDKEYWVIVHPDGSMAYPHRGNAGSPKLYQSEGRAWQWAFGMDRVVKVTLKEVHEEGNGS